jgi:hypothetical protein
MLPFYFLASVPDKRTKGIVILQQTGVMGIATAFREVLQAAALTEFPDYRIHLRNLSSRAVFDKFLSGKVREIRFIRFRVPKAIEDAYGVGHAEIKGRAEFVVKLKGMDGMPFAPKIQKFLNGDAELREIVEMADEHFEADAIKFDMDLNGKRRVLNVSKSDDLQLQYDVSKEVNGRGWASDY